MSSKQKSVDLFYEKPLPAAHYHPSPPRHKYSQKPSTIGDGNRPADAPCNEQSSYSLRKHGFQRAHFLLNLEEAERVQASPAFNESWPESERPPSPSIQEDMSVTSSDFERPLKAKDWNTLDSHKLSSSPIASSQSRLQPASSQTEDNNKLGSTLSKYIERFRQGIPLCREERHRLQTADNKDFWWLSSRSGSHSGTQEGSLAEQLAKPDLDKPVQNKIITHRARNLTQRNNPNEKKSTLTAENLMLSGLANGSSNPWQMDRETLQLQNRTDLLLEQTVSSLASSEPIISTDGLGSADSTTLSEIIDRKPQNQPRKTENSALLQADAESRSKSFLQTQPLKREEDILYQWRLKRKLESSRKLRSSTAGNITRSVNCPGQACHQSRSAISGEAESSRFETKPKRAQSPVDIKDYESSANMNKHLTDIGQSSVNTSNGCDVKKSLNSPDNTNVFSKKMCQFNKDTDSSFEELKNEHLKNLRNEGTCEEIEINKTDSVSGNQVKLLQAEKDETKSITESFNSVSEQNKPNDDDCTSANQYPDNFDQSETLINPSIQSLHKGNDSHDTSQCSGDDISQRTSTTKERIISKRRPVEQVELPNGDQYQNESPQTNEKQEIFSMEHRPDKKITQSKHRHTEQYVLLKKHITEPVLPAKRATNRVQSIRNSDRKDRVLSTRNRDHSEYETHKNHENVTKPKSQRNIHCRQKTGPEVPSQKSSPVRPISQAIGQVVMEHMMSSSLSLTDSETSVHGSFDALCPEKEPNHVQCQPVIIPAKSIPQELMESRIQQQGSISPGDILYVSDEEDFKEDDILQDLRWRRQQLIKALKQFDTPDIQH